MGQFCSVYPPMAMRTESPELWEAFWIFSLGVQAVINLFFVLYTYENYVNTPGLAWRPARQDELLYVGVGIAAAGLLYLGWTFTSPRTRDLGRPLFFPRIALLALAIAALGEIGWSFWFDLGYQRS
jgi:hypothetical protein